MWWLIQQLSHFKRNHTKPLHESSEAPVDFVMMGKNNYLQVNPSLTLLLKDLIKNGLLDGLKCMFPP